MSSGVYITGLGVASPLGLGAEAFWEALLAGRSAIGPMRRLDPSGFPCRHAAEVDDLPVKECVPKPYRKAVKVMARDTELAVVAAQLAAHDANIRTRGSGETERCASGPGAADVDLSRVACHIGAGLIAAEAEELGAALSTSTGADGRFSLRRWGAAEGGDGAMNNLPPLWLLKYLPNMLACHVTIIHGAEGPSNTITCAESSGLLSLGESVRTIERGDADLGFAGGAESKINPMGLLRLTLAGRLGHTAELLAEGDAGSLRAVRPFDAAARGGVPGEAGSILIAESGAHAAARGARRYARVAGFAARQTPGPLFPGSLDPAASMERPETVPPDRGVLLAARAAIRDAGLTPADIDAVVAGGFGTAQSDIPEAAAIREVLGDRCGRVPVLTLTQHVGNCSAGHGAMLAAAAALCLHHQRLPARAHAGRAVPWLDVGPSPMREASLRAVLVCCPSLGGQAAAAVLTRAEGAGGG